MASKVSQAALSKDKMNGRPHLYPGDIVRIHDGQETVVIVDAQITINGAKYYWHRKKWPEANDPSGWSPSYAIQPLPGGKVNKVAWYKAREFDKIIAFGPLHDMVEFDDED